MRVTCSCPTYKRIPLLEESLFCFLSQDYEDKQLLIGNDDPTTKIVYDHPNVTVLNYGGRFGHFYDKINDMMKFATGELVMWWDDDDIFAPWAIKTVVKHNRDEGMVCYLPYYKDFRGVSLVNSHLPGASVIKLSKWIEHGGIPEPYSDGHRSLAQLLSLFKDDRDYGVVNLEDNEVFLLWRRGEGFRDAWKSMRLNSRRFPEIGNVGTIVELKPRMRKKIKFYEDVH